MMIFEGGRRSPAVACWASDHEICQVAYWSEKARNAIERR